MKTLGIKSIHDNPGLLSKSLEGGAYSLITKHGVPVGIALGFESDMLEEGLKRYLVAKAFEAGDMSLGEVARAWKTSREEAMGILDGLCIPVADYSLEEEMAKMESLGL